MPLSTVHVWRVEAAAPTLLSIHRLARSWPSTFPHGSGPNAESDVSSRKQSLEKILPGTTAEPSRFTKLLQFHSGKSARISAPRAKIAEHSLLLSPRNFIGLHDRDCRSVRLTKSAQK